MRVSIGSDHRGYQLKMDLIEQLQQWGHEIADEGSDDDQSVDYPDIAAAVGQKVSRGEAERGILICGTGIGMSIAANKIAGVRAAACHDVETTELSRSHNDANVLCLSGNSLDRAGARRLVEIWLETAFDGARHQRRVEKIAGLENNNCS